MRVLARRCFFARLVSGLALLLAGELRADDVPAGGSLWRHLLTTHVASTFIIVLLVTGGLGFGLWVYFSRQRDRIEQARALAEERARAAEARRGQESADAANRAKSDFLATMSHEIRTPLNGIIGSAELMLETPLTPQQREYMATVQVSAEALLSIINDILDFSKIEAGRVQLEQAMFDLRQPIVEVMKIIVARAAGRDVEVILSIAPDVPTCVHGDAARLRQVLLNLCANAVKFTTRGHVLVRIERAGGTAPAGRETIRFAVTDTGIGIPAEARPRLFQKFSQADASTTRKFGGTGLGLAICKRLVELMGGEIGVVSEPGRGSTFWFTLTLPVEDLAGGAATGALRGGAWVIDGLEVRRQAVAEMVRGLGGAVREFASVNDALAMARETPRTDWPTAVLADESVGAAPAGEWDGVPWITLCAGNPEDTDARQTGVSIKKPLLQPEQLVEAMRVAAGGPRTVREERVIESEEEPRHRVLLAEDNAVNRMVASGMLRRLGCHVDLAENGAEAVVKARLNTYDFILLDCLMPEMDGWTAALEIRRAGGPGGRTPIIATTANATSADRDRCLNAGMNDYLAKPLRLSELARVVETYGRRDAGEAERAEAR